MKTLVLLLPFLVTAATESISVGGTILNIPTPPGAVTLSQRMTPLFEFQNQFVAPANEQFIAFIPESAVSRVLNGEMFLNMYFSVQTSKQLIGASLSSSDFSGLKQAITTQNEELIRNVEIDVQALLSQINEGISKQYDLDVALSMSSMIPLPPHYETDHSISYSSFVKYNISDESAISAPYIRAVTATIIHLKSKVIVLYCYAEKDALKLSRDISKEWSDATISANPFDFEPTVKEPLPSAVTGIDWEKVFVMSVSGVLIGAISILIFWGLNRRNRDDPLHR